MANLRIYVRDYRAIAEADITLSDLTVLAGVNSSGKSTIASLFHSFVEIDRNKRYYAEIQSIIKNKLPRWVAATLNIFGSAETINTNVPEFVLEWRKNVLERKNEMNPNSTENVLKKIIEILDSDAFRKYVNLFPQCLESLNRYSEHQFKTAEELSNWYKILLASYQKTYNDITTGPLYHGLYSYGFAENNHFMLEEYGEDFHFRAYDGESLVFDSIEDRIQPHSLISPNKSFYFANPSVDFPKKDMPNGCVVLGRDYYKTEKTIQAKKMPDWRKILGEAVNGSLEEPGDKDNVTSEWGFRQKGVKGLIDFTKCAEGIRSIIGLDILDRYDLLDSDSLIIIDEPEVHLHPQWIVACAKMLISLVKDVKARVLIATHSPYMVQALSTLSPGSLSPSQCKFYLSKPVGDGVHYKYENLGLNIGPIFESFNVALEDIALYEG